MTYGLTFIRRYFGGKLALDVQHDLRNQIFGSLSRLDGARQDELETGQIIGRATGDITMVQGLLSMLPIMTGNIILFVVSLVVMLVLSPLLTLIALAVGPGLLVIATLARKRLFPASWDASQQAAAVAAIVDDAVTGVRVVKGFGQEEQELGKLTSVAKRLFASRVRAARLTAKYNPSLQIVPALGQVGVLCLGGYLAVKGSISLGTFLLFSTYLAQLVGPVRMLSNLITIGQQARASVIRVFEVIDSKPIVTEKPDAQPLDPALTPDIQLDDITFGYLSAQPVLKGLSLHVAPGETVALVGTSGSGKSTLSMLLPRFYDVQSGAVRVGGIDVRDLTIDSIRASIGFVMEDSFLFSESVRANIAYGRPDATEEQIIAAAKAAEAHDFIAALPNGYDTMIGEQGLTLSGGQRQRVSLARALITDPRILMLDDATSAVDARIEAEIHATLHRVMAGRTTILIAHRRSTLELADRVAVLDEGRLVDIGTADELEARCPLYRLLLSGPGDDAEGVDAGELLAAAPVVDTMVDGVTPALWDPARAPDDLAVDTSGRVLSAAGSTGGGPWRLGPRWPRRPRRRRDVRGDGQHAGHAGTARRGRKAAAGERRTRRGRGGRPGGGSELHVEEADPAAREAAVGGVRAGCARRDGNVGAAGPDPQRRRQRCRCRRVRRDLDGLGDRAGGRTGRLVHQLEADVAHVEDRRALPLHAAAEDVRAPAAARVWTTTSARCPAGS